jgi:AAA domain
VTSPRAAVEDGPDIKFGRTPAGYLMTFQDIGVVFEARQVRWERGTLNAVVSLRTSVAGVRTVSGVVTEQRVNLSSDRGRRDIAGSAAERSPGVDIDWRGFVEDFAIRILAAEREGQPFQVVGNLPARVDPGYTVAPILPTGKVAFFYGPGAATKGFLMTALCMSVESGVEIVPGFRPTKGRALYLDWESDAYDLDDRVKRIAAGANMTTVPRIGYRECFGPLTDQVDDVAREIARSGITFLVVDSVGMALSTSHEGGDANESTIRMFQALRKLNVTTAAVDHVVGADIGKTGGKNSRPYGSAYKVYLARNTYEIRALAQKTEEPRTRHIVLTHRKANLGAYLSALGFAINFEGDNGPVWWETEQVHQVTVEEDDTGPASTRILIRDLLRDGHLAAPDLAEELGKKVSTIERVLRRYGPKAKKAEDRWFAKLPSSGRWEVLPAGLQETMDDVAEPDE